VEEEKEGIISLHIPLPLLRMLDALVKRGLFRSRSEAVRFAILLLLKEYMCLAEREKAMVVPLR